MFANPAWHVCDMQQLFVVHCCQFLPCPSCSQLVSEQDSWASALGQWCLVVFTAQVYLAASMLGPAGDLEASRTIVECTKLFKVTVSFGNVISLISLPCFMSHASIPAEVRAARGLPDDLVRISAGIEDVGDLIADLKQAMDKAWAEQQQRQQLAAASNGGGSSSSSAAVVAGSNGSDQRMQQLEQRILQLEAQLQAGQQQLQNSHI